MFSSHTISSVIHFAGLKAVGQSVEQPLEYYDNNVVGTLRLLEVMKEFGCKKLFFQVQLLYIMKLIQNYTPLTESKSYWWYKLTLTELVNI